MLCSVASATVPAYSQDRISQKDTTLHIDESIVTGIVGPTRRQDSSVPYTLISVAALEKGTSSNIIDKISKFPGISQITTGSGISKPVIRGLGYNRVVVIDDGIRQEGQQWGDEHGIEVDADNVGSAEILKGTASLMYGSDAIGGVLIMKSPEVNAGFHAGLSTSYQSCNGLASASFHFSRDKNGIIYAGRYSEKGAHQYRNSIDGIVPGSQFHERDASGMFGVKRKKWNSKVRLSYYDFTPSMTESESESSDLTYRKALPYQHIHHYKALSDNQVYIGNGCLGIIAGYQLNRRQEYEDGNTPGLDMQLGTFSFNADYLLPGSDGWKFRTGLSGLLQHSVNKGEELLIPDYWMNEEGMFFTVSKTMQKWLLEGGVRYDHRYAKSMAMEDKFNVFTRHFQNVSGSIGAVCRLSDAMMLRFNVSRGFRAPNISELSADGEHEGTFRYEKGNSALKPEVSHQADAGYELSLRRVSLSADLFINRISNYIYAGKTSDEKIENLPVFSYMSGAAVLKGGELTADWHPLSCLHIGTSFSYVSSRQLGKPVESRYLPFTPAPRSYSEIKYELPKFSRTVTEVNACVNYEYNFRQNRYYSAYSTETATPGYGLLGAELAADFCVRGRKFCSVVLFCDNITDEAYQSHLSRLKYAGYIDRTGRYGFYNPGRNFGVKLVFAI